MMIRLIGCYSLNWPTSPHTLSRLVGHLEKAIVLFKDSALMPSRIYLITGLIEYFDLSNNS